MTTNLTALKHNSKKKIYAVQQLEIFNKLNEITGISSENNNILRYDIEDKKEEILKLKDDVKKFFSASKWAFFQYEEINKENAILLMKSIYKEAGYKIFSKNITIERNGKKFLNRQYTLIKI